MNDIRSFLSVIVLSCHVMQTLPFQRPWSFHVHDFIQSLKQSLTRTITDIMNLFGQRCTGYFEQNYKNFFFSCPAAPK